LNAAPTWRCCSGSFVGYFLRGGLEDEAFLTEGYPHSVEGEAFNGITLEEDSGGLDVQALLAVDMVS
jgi:hypothetical protein